MSTQLPEEIYFRRIPRSAAAKIFKGRLSEDTLAIYLGG